MRPYLLKKLQLLRSQSTEAKKKPAKRNSRKKMSDIDIISHIAIVEKILTLSQRKHNSVPVRSLIGEDMVCWNDEVFKISRDARFNVYRFYMLVLDGPLTQFILESNIPSLTQIGELFTSSGCIKDLRLQLLKMYDQETPNILKSNRFLMASLLSFIELQEARGVTTRNSSNFSLAIGNTLLAVSEVVSRFYKSYEEFPQSEASALVYESRWETASVRLFRSFLMRNIEVKRQTRGFDDMFKSGMFFPNHPQVRPMPFNDKVDFRGRHGDYGACSKHYDSQRPDFTPGALTFCCACSHPVVFGFKTLERGEGPRAVLDVLISRFPNLPSFVVYDFACGLFRSAQHTLWWATKNTTFVSDRFHVDNHTCHRGFHPDSYNYLNGRNTVSHEQRNRPIANLKGSLRNCSQSLYVSLLAYHTLYLNLKAKIRQKQAQMRGERGTSIMNISGSKRHRNENENELSEDEVQAWYFNVFGFQCQCCKPQVHITIT